MSEDPLTGELVPLFNPRQQVWREHFAWSDDGARMIGLTACGRATVAALNVNNPGLSRANGFYVVDARQLWVEADWHPPLDDL